MQLYERVVSPKGRVTYMEHVPCNMPPHKNTDPMNRRLRLAAVNTSLALGALDCAKRTFQPNSAIWNRFNSAEIAINRALGMIEPDYFGYDECVQAQIVFEVAEAEMNQRFP